MAGYGRFCNEVGGALDWIIEALQEIEADDKMAPA
jgi:hypothetical protein